MLIIPRQYTYNARKLRHGIASPFMQYTILRKKWGEKFIHDHESTSCSALYVHIFSDFQNIPQNTPLTAYYHSPGESLIELAIAT